MSNRRGVDESFIHRDLEAKAAAIVETTRAAWKKQRKIDPYVVTWPSEELKGDDGSTITHAVYCAIPIELDAAKRMHVLQQLIERTKAYGLVFVEQRDRSIRVMFETAQRARSWCIPLSWHGDIQVPGQTESSDERVGLLWQKGPRS
jgi:hypothetical protein